MKTLSLILALLCGSPLPAQGAQGQQDTQQLIDKIRKQLEEIDRLLNQAARSRAGGGGAEAGTAGGSGAEAGTSASRKMLEGSLENSKSVVETIERLLQQGSNQSQNSQSQGQSQDQGKNKDRKQGKADDRDADNPDFVDQGQQQKQQGEGRPDGPEKDPLTGRNVDPRSKQDDPTGKTERDAAAGAWGKLPPYLQRLFQKGGGPKVPDKYRSYYEEFLRNADKKKDR